MQTNSPATDPLRQRPRLVTIALVAVAAVLVAALLTAGIGVWVALRELPRIAKWMIERSIPGVEAKLGDVSIELPGRLQARELTLTSKADGGHLLTLRGGTVDFDFRELAGGRVASVELVEPRIEVSPKLLALLANLTPKQTADASARRKWTIGRLLCKYGEVRTSGIGPEELKIDAKFSFDFTGFPVPARDLHEIFLWDLQASAAESEPFFRVDLAEIAFDPAQISGRIETVRIKGGSLVLGHELLALFEGEGTSPSPGATAGLTIGRLEIARVGIRLEEDPQLGAGIRFSLNTTFANVPLNKAASALGEEPQAIEVADLEILSPLDPLTKVLSIRSLLAEFTLAGLLRREIRAITVTSPLIHVSPDLFWYMEYAQKRFGEEGDGQGGPGWTVRQFILTGGRLLLGSGGRESYGLPLTFRTSAENVNLGNLASLRAQAALEIPAQQYVFEDYKLEFTSQPGELRFGYPPEKDEKNIVGTVRLDSLRWRQYRAADSWVSVTFDRSGINGLFGGEAYGGYLSGGFSFFFDAESHWVGWLSGKKISMRQLTDVIAPQNFRMTGPFDFRLQVDARRAEIQRVKGDLIATRTGALTIAKLDDMLGRVPDGWPSLKQDSVRIALETLRDFDYTKCSGDFWFVDSQGVLDLVLQGPSGSRTFEVVLHADDSTQGRWKKPLPR